MGRGALDIQRARFKLLYERHADDVLRYILRRIARDEAEDVLSETFLTAWRRLDDIPLDPLPWLFGVARRQIANRTRSRHRRQALTKKLLAEWSRLRSSGADVPLIAHHVDERLLVAIRRLPEAEREAFILVAWDGLEPSRAARAAGCSPQTFRVRLHRARRRLRGWLGASEPPDALDRNSPRLEEAGW